MSAGVIRKQYEALTVFAASLGITVTTPSGSFNEKFCELSRVIVTDLGGSFTPVTEGTFTSRKAVYLRQIAVALGITTGAAGTSFRETFLKAAYSIWDTANDGTGPDTGASLDWRVFQYLNHAIGGPGSLDPLQWLYKLISPEAIDKTANALDADLVGSNAVTLDGVADYLSAPTAGMDANKGTVSLWIAYTDAGWGGFWHYWTFYSDRLAFLSADITAKIRLYCGGTVVLESPLSYNDGNPHHVAFTYDFTADEYELYVDGSNVDSDTTSLTAPTLAATQEFGCYYYTSRTGFFDGDLWDARTYDTVLTPAQVAALYAGTEPTNAVVTHIPMAGGLGMGTDEPDTSGNGNDGTWTTGAGGVTTLRSGTQDVVHRNLIEGHSKTLAEVGATTIAVTGLVGTETITETGTGSVAASAGTLTLTGGYVSTISIDGLLTYELKNAYGTAIPSSNGTWPDGVLTNGGHAYYPALDDGSDDTEGLGLTNPPATVHNNAETKIKQKAANTEFLLTPFWSADGVNYDAKSFEDFITHENFDYNVLVKASAASSIEDVLTWAMTREWTPSEYLRLIAWLGSSVVENMVPAEVTAGTGIGPNLDWADNGNGCILFVEDA